MDDDQFAAAIEELRRWKRVHLPMLDRPSGIEVFDYLLRRDGGAVPLRPLYRSATHSEPTVRGMLQEFIARNLAALEVDPDDSRRKAARPTSLMLSLADEYRRRVCGVGLHLTSTENAKSPQ